MNPGPVTNSPSIRATSNDRSDFLLNYRFLRYGLRGLDVGGRGDCLFKPVSHELYSDSSHHLEIRAAGILYEITLKDL